MEIDDQLREVEKMIEFCEQQNSLQYLHAKFVIQLLSTPLEPKQALNEKIVEALGYYSKEAIIDYLAIQTFAHKSLTKPEIAEICNRIDWLKD